MTVTDLATFDDSPLEVFTFTNPLDGTTKRIEGADAEEIVSALIPGYSSLTDLDALLGARRAHAHQLRVALQREINATARADGTWSDLTDEEKSELTRAAMGQVPVGLVREELVWIAGFQQCVFVGRWEGEVELIVNRTDYGLLADDGDTWNEEPLGDTMVRLDSTDDEAYVESLEEIGILIADSDAPLTM